MTFDHATDHHREFVADAAQIGACRSFVGQVLTSGGAPAGMVRDFQLTASEIVSNAIEHSSTAVVGILVDVSDPKWWVVAINSTHADAEPTSPFYDQRPAEWLVGSPEAASGRGLGIARRLMDDIEVRVHNGEVAVHCRRRRDEAGAEE